MLCMDCNETSLDLFMCEIDKTILSGNIIYIENAIKKYENVINDILFRWTSEERIIKIDEDIELFATYWLNAKEVINKDNKKITASFNELAHYLINENFLPKKGVRKLKTAS